ncbi:MAG: tryptophan-rich sensory protein [Calditrichaeota bacterium]|nr:MAG: tryptophan-rich sensory protein [Calditrichota bacterium]
MTMKFLQSRNLSLLFWIAVSGIVSYSGAQFEPGTWYQSIQKPELTPPGWVFPVVWTSLYIMMAIAAWKVWLQVLSFTETAIWLYMVKMLLNASWSYIFFGVHIIWLSVVNILALFFVIVVLIYLFNKISKTAAKLMIPYAIWVGFASFLNIRIWMLN